MTKWPPFCIQIKSYYCGVVKVTAIKCDCKDYETMLF